MADRRINLSEPTVKRSHAKPAAKRRRAPKPKAVVLKKRFNYEDDDFSRNP